MLWQKSWWETRLGLLVFTGVTMAFVFWLYPWGSADLAEWASSLRERAPEDLLPLLGSCRGYVWSNWFKLLLLMMWPVYAVTQAAAMSAISCPWMAGGVGASGLFTYSLPVSRRSVVLTQAAMVGVEMVLVALAPSLLFPIVSLFFGGEIPFGSAVIHALLLSLGGMVFPAFSFLLTAVFNDLWKTVAIGIAAVFAFFIPIRPIEEYPWWNIYHVMSGETYFRYGQIPWLGLLASLGVSALMMFAAVRIYERRDF